MEAGKQIEAASKNEICHEHLESSADATVKILLIIPNSETSKYITQQMSALGFTVATVTIFLALYTSKK